MCKVLNVAEKNDAAKSIAGVMSNGSCIKVKFKNELKFSKSNNTILNIYIFLINSVKVTPNLIKSTNFHFNFITRM